MRRWTEQEIEYLKNNYMNMSYSDIGEHIDRNESMIRAKCFELNLVKKDRWSDEEIEYIKANYPERSAADIGIELGRTETAVRIKAKKLGVKKYPYYCNQDYFKDIDTEEKAYWLGFIYADGYVTINKETNSGVVGIELQDGDVEHLKKFNKSISGNYKIIFRDKHCNLSKDENQISHMCGIRVYSIRMAENLIYHGVYERKSYHLDSPVLDEPLMRHFIRGFFDGDGCVRTKIKKRKNGVKKSPSCDFSCHEFNFIESLRSFLYKNEICSYIGKDKENYRLYIDGNHAFKLLNFMYKDSNIYLERKYKRYEDIVEYTQSTQECLAV